MPATVLGLLKIVFLIFLYLFIARVVRAVWVEIFAERRTLTAEPEPAAEPSRRAPAPMPAAALSRREKRSAAKAEKQRFVLKVVEPPEHRGTSYPVTDEMTIGRAPGCAVPIHDTFASQIHARIFRRDGAIFLEDLGSTNGTFLNRKKVTGPMPVTNRDRVQIGSTVLELQK
jgi:pSer/pThr/pTyr-binding forkhead associated (FHA) protein